MNESLTINYETEGYSSEDFGSGCAPKTITLDLETEGVTWPTLLEEFVGFLQLAGWPMGFHPSEIKDIVYDYHRESLRKKVRSRDGQQMSGMRENEGSDHEMGLF